MKKKNFFFYGMRLGKNVRGNKRGYVSSRKNTGFSRVENINRQRSCRDKIHV